MEEFCGSPFWNESLIWNAMSQPDLTPCFEKTLLVWIPCLFLWGVAPIETHYLIHSKDRNIPWSLLNILKIIGSLILLGVELALLISNIVHSDMNIYNVDYLAPSLLFISILLQLIMVIMEKKRGLQSSAYLFLFWMLMVICGIPAYRTHFLTIENKTSTSMIVEFITYMIYYPVVVIMFLLNFFADKRPEKLFYPRGEKYCPEEDSSFPSRLTFSWLDSLVWRGYKNPITQDILWDLSYNNKSQKITSDWNHNWFKTTSKSYKKEESRTRATFTQGSNQVQVVGTMGKKHYVSIFPTLLRSFGPEVLFGSLLKLFHDLLQFVSPLLISLLIAFTEDISQPVWRGYLYAFLFLVVTQTQSLVLGQYFARMFIVGLKIRTAVISAVYCKALRISNSARKESTLGEIVNLMSVDAQRFMDLTTYLNMIWSAPLQIALSLYFLWQILGPSVLAGLAIMVVLIPVNGFVANQQKKLQIKQMREKDRRVKLINEILNGIKVLKLYAWEPSFEDQVLAIRRREIKVLKKAAYLNAATSFTWLCTPFMMTLLMFAVFVLSAGGQALTPTIAFVSLTLINILRMPMSILPTVISSIVQVSLATFAVYVFVSDLPLDPQTAFVSLALFNMLRFPMTMLPMMISSLVQAGVSLKRMNKFLNADELDPTAVTRDKTSGNAILVENGSFTWDPAHNDILKGINLKVKLGALVGVVGSVGAGKSSLCSAILGEMEKTSGRISVQGSMAYVAQQAWIQNATVEKNILFGRDPHSSPYRQVVEACALSADLEMLPARDQTEIGEKGINLSGGQKQRVSLARAVYAGAQVYLLDDPLSAVDAHVGKHIFERVIGPHGMLKDKTRVFVTHSLTYLRYMDHIVVMKGGAVSEQGTYEELIAKKGEFQEFLLQYLSEGDSNEEEGLAEIKSELERSLGRHVVQRQISSQRRTSESSADSSTTMRPHKSCELSQSGSHKMEGDPGNRAVPKGTAPSVLSEPRVGEKLIEAEKAETGKVSLGVYMYYIRALGPLATAFTLLFYMASQGFSVGTNIWLSEWSEDENATQPAIRDMYLGVYGALGFLQAVWAEAAFWLLAWATVGGAAKLHFSMLQAVIRSQPSFFDTTPIGRVVNRFSKDVDAIDVILPIVIRTLLFCICSVISTLLVIVYATPIFAVVLVPVMVIYYFVQLVYVKTSRQLKRIESVSRSPIYSHFGETIQGASTIRAFGKENDFILESQKKVDFNQISYYPSIIANRWLAIRLEFIGNILTFFAALFAVMGRSNNITGGLVGLSISYALSVTQTLNWLVRMTSDVETNIVAVERIKEYSETPQEAPWKVPGRKPPNDWPDCGAVEFDDYSTRYRPELGLVIKGIRCRVKPTEKVGIVGRTGAGKSSLTLALFRLLEAAGGCIRIDEIDISKIGLHDLRHNLTIIPQDPVLFSGTLRLNLDPFSEHSDAAVWSALEHSHLKSFVGGLESKLQHEITEGGDNLSVGQRQLVCLARALLRKTKVLVLDEATAAVDLETDDLIQATIRREFVACTVLTIAHRLNTIMDADRVIVMEDGQIKEFDSPSNLLKDPTSRFLSMAKDAKLA